MIFPIEPCVLIVSIQLEAEEMVVDDIAPAEQPASDSRCCIDRPKVQAFAPLVKGESHGDLEGIIHFLLHDIYYICTVCTYYI